MNIGKLIVAYRQKYDVSVKDLAEQMQVPRSTISRLENSESSVDFDTGQRIINWLFKAEGKEAPKDLYSNSGVSQ